MATRTLSSIKTAVEEALGTQGDKVTTYSTIYDLPLSGDLQVGDKAFVQSNALDSDSLLYFWNGSGWYKLATVNQSPSFDSNGSPLASYSLATDGTPTVVTLLASDPEGLPIQWSFETSGLVSEATVVQGTGDSANKFTITPSSSESDEGEFIITFKASDGVNLTSAASTFSLAFLVNYSTTQSTNASSFHFLKNEIYVIGRGTRTELTGSGETVNNAFAITKYDDTGTEVYHNVIANTKNNYTGQSSGPIAVTSNYIFFATKSAYVFSNSIRNTITVTRFDRDTGNYSQGSQIGVGSSYSAENPSYIKQSVLGGILLVGGDVTTATNYKTLTICRFPETTYVSGDTINANSSHFYKYYTVASASYDSWSAPSSVFELSDGSIVTINTHANYYNSFANSHTFITVSKFSADGTPSTVITQRPHTTGTSTTAGHFLVTGALGSDDKILICTNYLGDKNTIQLTLLNSDLTLNTTRAFSINGQLVLSNTTNRWSCYPILAADGDFIIMAYDDDRNTAIIGKVSGSDLSDQETWYRKEYIADLSSTQRYLDGTLGAFVFNRRTGTNPYELTRKSGKFDGTWPPPEFGSAFGTPSSVSITTQTPRWSNTYTTTNPSEINWTENEYQTSNLFDLWGNYPTSSGADAYYWDFEDSSFSPSLFDTRTISVV